MKVSCDKCHMKYKLNLKEASKTIEGKRIERVFFVCPKCGCETTVIYKNRSMEVLQNQIKRIYRCLEDENLKDEEVIRLVNRINRKKEKINQIKTSLYLMYDEKFRNEV